jgi:hypothetical protein
MEIAGIIVGILSLIPIGYWAYFLPVFPEVAGGGFYGAKQGRSLIWINRSLCPGLSCSHANIALRGLTAGLSNWGRQKGGLRWRWLCGF